jgi:hypothetical protein
MVIAGRTGKHCVKFQAGCNEREFEREQQNH